MRIGLYLIIGLALGCSSAPSDQLRLHQGLRDSAATDLPSPSVATPAQPAAAGPIVSAAEVSRGTLQLPLLPAPILRMRTAEYFVEGDESALMTVFYFGAGQGGSVEANVNRWVGQMQQPDGSSSQEAADIAHVPSGISMSLLST